MKTRFIPWLCLLFAGGVGPVACNALTGIGDFSIDPNFGGAGGEGGTAGSGGAAGIGGMGGGGGAGGAGGGMECATELTCPGETNACQTRSCLTGVCQLTKEVEGTPVPGQMAGDCMRMECDAMGQVRTVVDKTDVPDDGLECTQDECDAMGMPLHTPKVLGATCTQGAGQVCNDVGQCVQCNFNMDCGGGGLCDNGTCVPPECNDQIRNGNESDIDCGGTQCVPCGVGLGCMAKTDCASKICVNGTCRAPTCNDMEANGDETDVDCGGPTCPADCANDKMCLVAGDCVSGVCNGGMCQAPACNDGVKNGNETDVDCGANCPGCSLGKPCNVGLDCTSTVCRSGTCMAVVQIDAGTAHACALLSDGTVFCWGANGAGQLGDGTTIPRLSPVQVSGLSGVTQIATGANTSNSALNGHTCARTNDGKLYCWGRNANGQIGDSTLIDVSSPKQILGADVVQVSTGRFHTCARLVSGAVQCWGNNVAGQLGSGNVTNTTAPGATIAGLSARSISAGMNHTCAILTTGELSCWGGNAQGQLGNGTTMNSVTPTLVPGLSNITAIKAGYAFTCAVDGGGVLRCFGSNSFGELGLGNMMNQTSPQIVTGVMNAVGVPCGVSNSANNAGGHTC
ncbi:MAG TPA: hypothetical protein PK156_47095 [Polyangium sp.]|nr:hypothetical protein [Polyangium sp.]